MLNYECVLRMKQVLVKPSDTCAFKAKDPFSPPGKPDAPVIEEVTKDGASLSWTAPSKDGGAPITNYIVEMRHVGDVRWQVANKNEKTPHPKYTVSGLEEDVDYEFRIVAENKAGTGPPSDPSKPGKYSMYDTYNINLNFMPKF